jgi:hypothetical protein
MVRFQMKTSNRPQTIAVVKSKVDIDSFRSNPEWYEIVEEQASMEVVTRKRKVKGASNGDKEEKD